MTSVLIRTEDTGDTQRRQACEEGEWIWNYVAISQGMFRPLKEKKK